MVTVAQLIDWLEGLPKALVLRARDENGNWKSSFDAEYIGCFLYIEGRDKEKQDDLKGLAQREAEQ